MKKKSLIALMCAGVVAIAPLAISGCADEIDGLGDVDRNVSSVRVGENLIVALYEKKVTLHKGDMYILKRHTGYASHYTATKFEFVCGDSVITDRYVVYPEGVNVGDEDKYDEICHECFPDVEVIK